MGIFPSTFFSVIFKGKRECPDALKGKQKGAFFLTMARTENQQSALPDVGKVPLSKQGRRTWENEKALKRKASLRVL